MCYCYVPGCKSGYGRNRNGRRFFTPPKEYDLFTKWEKAIPRIDKPLTAKSRVCDVHFSEDLIVKMDCFVVNGIKVELPRVKWKLKPGAVPHIFPSLPKYLTTDTEVVSRKAPSRKSNEDSFRTRNKNHNVGEAGVATVSGQVQDANAAKRKAEKVTVMCDPNYSQESLRMGEESEEHEAIPQVCIKQEVVVKEEVQDPLEYLEEFQEEQPSWSENNFSSRENLMEGDSNALCEPVPQVWVKEEIEVKEEVPDPLEISEETIEEQPSCSEFR